MANRYWVGGTGNWSDTTHWSASSGGAGSAGVPTSTDDVYFDTASSTANAAYTVTVNATANCANFTMDGPDPADAAKVTWAGTSALNIYGNLNLSGGTAGITRTYGGTVTFLKASGTATITTNSVILYHLVFNKAGTTFQLVDDLYSTGNFTLTAGTFDASTNSRTVYLQGSNYTITPTVSLTFYNLNIDGSLSGSQRNISFAGGITVSNVLTISGNSAINRNFIKSTTLGTARTLTAATVTVTNADFQDITGAGAATWDLSAITGGSGDCGGNTGITFTTATTWYWHADTGNVSDYTKWYTATNGGGSQMASTLVPLPQDTLRFDDSSFTAGSKTVTQNMPRIGSIDFTGATNTPTFTTSTYADVYGSITLISGMTLTASTQDYSFYNRGNYTLDSGGLSWAKPIRFYGPGGVCTLKSNLTTSNSSTIGIYASSELSVVDGANNWSISVGILTMFSGCFFNPGSATHYITRLTGTGMTGAGTFRNNTSTFKWTGALTGDVTFTTGNINYNGASIWNATTNNYALIINNSSTFNDFKIDAGRTVKFTNSTNTTVNTFTALGTAGSHITISNSSLTTPATLTKAGGGIISGCDYIDASYLTGSPADTWYIGSNSTDAVGSSLTNIYLLDAPASAATGNFFNFI